MRAFGTARGHEDRRRRRRHVVELELVGLKVAALKGNSLTTPKLPDELDGFDQAVMTLLVRPELCRGRLLVEPLAGSDAEEHAAGVEHCERRERVRDGRRVVAIGRTRHAGAKGDVVGSLAHQCQRDPGEHRMPLVVLPRLDVVAGPQIAESGLLGRVGLVDKLRSGELLVPEHQAQTRSRRRWWRGRCGRGAGGFGCARGHSAGRRRAGGGREPAKGAS